MSRIVRISRSLGVGVLMALAAALAACSSSAGGPASGEAAGTLAPSQQVTTVTDIVGRRVDVKTPVRRMILSEGRILYVVAILEPDDPFKQIVGWGEDLRINDFDTYEKYREKFPHLTQIPFFGNAAQGGFSVEKAIDLNPDVVVFTYDSYVGARETGLLDKLAAVGIPSVVIDFRQQPLENTIPSVLLLGRLLGQQERAQRFVDYYTEQVNLVSTRLERVKQARPLAFIYRAAGLLDCCATFGNANLGLMVERAGGINLGSRFIPGWSGVLNPEQILATDPEVIIITGSNWRNAKPEGGFVTLGYQTPVTVAQRDLQDLVARTPGWSGLQAVKNKRVHAIWHQFYITPYHFITLLQFAKWLYPQDFADVDVEAVYRDFHAKFLPVSYSGTFFTSLP